MLLKMKVGLSGPHFNLAPGAEHEFEDAEAGRLIAADYAVEVKVVEKAVAPAEYETPEKPVKRKRGKADVVSAEGDDAAG